MLQRKTVFSSAILAVLFSIDSANIASAQTSPQKFFQQQPEKNAVIDISFSEFFKMPVGPRGLEPSEKLLSLNGKHIRIKGYMVEEEESKPGIFILASHPTSLSDVEDGPADDLPATHLTVHAPEHDAEKIAPYRTGLVSLSGRLDIGNSEENNGRLSFVRLWLDKPSPSKQKSTINSPANKSNKTAMQHKDSNNRSAT